VTVRCRTTVSLVLAGTRDLMCIRTGYHLVAIEQAWPHFSSPPDICPRKRDNKQPIEWYNLAYLIVKISGVNPWRWIVWKSEENWDHACSIATRWAGFYVYAVLSVSQAWRNIIPHRTVTDGEQMQIRGETPSLATTERHNISLLKITAGVSPPNIELYLNPYGEQCTKTRFINKDMFGTLQQSKTR
jgi:hypothetical protein